VNRISVLTLALQSSESDKLSQKQLRSLSPSLQGVLMEHIGAGYAAELHQLPFNPYSQYCYWDSANEILRWRICALTNEAAEQVLKPMQGISKITLRRLSTTLSISTSSLDSIELKALTSMIHDNPQTKVNVTFLTPTAFKSAGNYVFIPTTRLIFQNLFMRYSQIYEGDKEVDSDTIDYLESHTAIAAYKLRSQYFDLSSKTSKRIPAFTGSMTISSKGPQALTGLVQMLLKFGEYSGIGIKTSMGMGGTQCSLTSTGLHEPTKENKVVVSDENN